MFLFAIRKLHACVAEFFETMKNYLVVVNDLGILMMCLHKSVVFLNRKGRVIEECNASQFGN